MDERVLTERLIRYDTSKPDGLRSAAGFVKGWLESHDLDVEDHDHRGLPVIMAETGPPPTPEATPDHTTPNPAIILHGHLDVVPGREEQFTPRLEGDRLFGRGAYDMKGGLAAMMCAFADLAAQRRVRVRLLVTPDEESEELDDRSTDALVASGYRGDFAITGEPTNLEIGVQAKGVLALQLLVTGRAAHGSTPWLGDNAVLKAVDVFRRIETMPFSRESSELFDRPSINLGRIRGGDAVNMVPDSATMDVDIRYLPGQDPDAIRALVADLDDVRIVRTFTLQPANVAPSNPYVLALGAALTKTTGTRGVSVGRDGASEAVAFIGAGIPTVEFGPTGAGHHGPEEWVSVSSLVRYRAALHDFVDRLPERLGGARDDGRPVESGHA